MTKCRVILVGENRLFLEGLSLALESDNLTVIGTSRSGLEVISLLAAIDEQPDLMLWDSQTSFDQDIARWAEIHRELPKIGIVVLSEQVDAASANRAIATGVRGFLPKCISAGALGLSLQLVALSENLFTVPFSLAGGWQDPAAMSARAESGELRIPLSSREAEILQCLWAGAPNKVIARELGVTEATVKVHVKAILRKISVSNRTQAAIWAKSHLPRIGN
jgi:two-component system nitrate/nitrite response regulator NarL